MLKLDALFTILEKHLYDFGDDEESETVFIEKIVGDYLQFLSTQKVIIPKRWHAQVVEELRDQVRKMLIKKMYGCLTIGEYVKKQPTPKEKCKEVRKKYSKLF